MHRAASMATWLLTAAVGSFVALVATGQLSIVETHGTSMRPTYTQGDLVLVRRDTSYSAGQIVAYRLPARHVVVLHRIIAKDPAGYVFKGDNNTSLDSAHPKPTQLVGRAIVHIPQGGVWLHRLVAPLPVSLVVLLVCAGASRAQYRTRSSRRRRRMSRAARPRHQVGSLVLSPAMRGAAVGAAVMAVLSAALGVLAWSGPVEETRSQQVASGRAVTFSYSAQVPHSAAYDGTSVAAPDPVFRKLANDVAVLVSYDGDPGSLAVAAELSTPAGWHSTVVLAPTTRFSTRRYQSKVKLDLTALTARGHAAASASGMPETDISVSIRATVRTAAGATFAAALALRLTPLQLALAGTPADLHVTDNVTTSRATTAPRMISLQRWQLAAGTGRRISALMVALAIGVVAIGGFIARRQPRDEASRIRRRYAPLLSRVLPIDEHDAGLMVDVPEFATMAKLAERNGSLILYWSRGNVETYLVRDEGTTYRFRTDAAASHGQRHLVQAA
jgi:signal peptidase I